MIADSSKEKFNNALSANNKQTEKSELDSPIIAPMESDNAEKMTKANYVLNAKEDSNFSEKLSKDETFTDKEVTAEINDLSTGRANTEAMNSGKDITALDNINLNENREKLDPVSTTNTFASVSSSTINNVKNRLGEISEDKENSMEKVLSPEEAPELEALGEGNTSKSLDDSSDASDKAVESEQENKLLEDINISELAEEIEPVDLQNILRNEDTQNLSEQTQQFKGINTENVVANNKFSEEIIDADINSIDSEIINLTTSIVDVESLKEVSQSEEDNDEEVTVQALTDSDLEIQDPIVNPILAQIQAAQKTDTKVTDNELQSSAGIGNIEKGNKKNGLSLSKDVSKDSIKVDKNNIENVLADASEKSTLLEKDLINKANISANEKLEGMLANFKAEAAKPFFNQNNESSSLNSLGTASANADKLLHQTQTNATNPTLQSSALKQPLELQAKHASAMVGERIMMMINQGKQEVTIRLDPAELGSMHIKLHVQQDQLQVAIQTQVGQSRDIIEQNLPRLREQLAQQGINLGEASVEQQGKQQQSNSQDSSQMGRSAQGTGGQGESFVEEQSEFFPTQIPLPAQGIDYYA